MNLISKLLGKKETFLCAKYDYKIDIAVKQEEAYIEGYKHGLTMSIVRSFYFNGASIELIAKSLDMTIDQIKEIIHEDAN